MINPPSQNTQPANNQGVAAYYKQQLPDYQQAFPFGDYTAKENDLNNLYKQQLSYLQNDKPLGGPAGYSQSTDYALQTLGQNRAQLDLFNAQQKALAVDRDRQINALQRRSDTDLAQKRATLGIQRQQKIDELAGQGVAPGSAFDRQIQNIYTDENNYEKSARQELEDRVSDINAGYTAQVNQIAAQHQQDLAQIQQRLSDRLFDLQKQKTANEQVKTANILKVQQDYQTAKEKLADDYYNVYKDAETRRQQALQNEIAVSNLTGEFRGQPTMGQQKADADQAYRQQQLALAQQRLALSQSRAARVGSGGSSLDMNAVNQVYDNAKKAQALNGGQIGDYLPLASSSLNAKSKMALYGKTLSDIASGAIKFLPSQKMTPQAKASDSINQIIANSLSSRLQSLKK